MPVTVTLTPWQYKACVDCAAARMATSNEAGWDHASTYRRTYLERTAEEIVGVCGELAAARALNVFWYPSVNTFHAVSDLPGGIEVRSTTKTTGRVSLIVRDNDPVDRVYVLVTGEPPDMNVVGWISGADARSDEFRCNPNGDRPAWFVPVSRLAPINVLAEDIITDREVQRA